MPTFITNIITAIKQWVTGIVEDVTYVTASHVVELREEVNNLTTTANALRNDINILENMQKGWICFYNNDLDENITAYKCENEDININGTTYYCYKTDNVCYYVTQLASNAYVYQLVATEELLQIGTVYEYILSLEQLNTIIQAQ